MNHSAQWHQQAQLVDVFVSAPDAILTLDAHQRIVLFNPAAERLFGCPAAAARGQLVSQFIPDPRYERGRRQNGEEFPLEATVSYSQVQGQETITVILRDVTRQKQLEEQLQTQKQLFENLVAVARATGEQLTLGSTLHNVLEVGVALTSAERGSLFLLDAQGSVIDALAVREAAPIGERHRVVSHVRSQGLLGWVIAHRQPALIDDTRQDERWVQLSDAAVPTHSALAVPILRGTALLGVLILMHSQARRFTAEHLQLIQAAADQMSLALQNAQSFEVQRRMADRQTILYEVLRAVGAQLDPDAVARIAIQQITTLTGWRNVVIATWRTDRPVLEIRAASGHLENTQGVVLTSGRGIMMRACLTGRTQCVPDVSRDAEYVMGDPGTRSELAVPLRRGGRVRGVLNIESDQLAAFDTYDISLVEALADAVALALDNAAFYRAIAEEHSRLQAMINTSRDGIALLGLNRRILVCNSPLLEFLGLSGQPKVWAGRSIVEALWEIRRAAPRSAHTLHAEMRRIRAGDEPAAEGEVEIPPRIVYWFSQPVLSGSTVLGRLVVVRDVTVERQLSRMRDDLTHMLVHDLRNPLGVVLGSYDIMAMDTEHPLSEMQQQMSEVGQRAAERMMDLVTAILDVSRLENGQMPLERRPLALHLLVAETLRLQTVLANEKELQLVNEVPAELPPVLADPNLLGRVIQNLVGNAIKFTPAGGTIRMEASRPVHGFVAVSVKDSGPGIPPDVQSRLFQRFATGGQKEHGTGLGLAFCKLVVEAHGGTIEASSRPGEGATFTFTLPLSSAT